MPQDPAAKLLHSLSSWACSPLDAEEKVALLMGLVTEAAQEVDISLTRIQTAMLDLESAVLPRWKLWWSPRGRTALSSTLLGCLRRSVSTIEAQAAYFHRLAGVVDCLAASLLDFAKYIRKDWKEREENE